MVNFIGEIGINHNGKLENALDLVREFSFLDGLKMQKTNPKRWMTEEQYNAPHPTPENAFHPDSYGLHRAALELSTDEYRAIQSNVKGQGQLFGSSCFDLDSAADVISLNPDWIKIPSCRCNAKNLLDYVSSNYKGPVHISTGMTSKAERDSINYPGAILYNCLSDYSGDNVIYITNDLGFSCHSKEILFAQAAILNGAKWIEYHITLDRSQKGSDHKISLLPSEYKELVEWYNSKRDVIDRIEWGRPDEVAESEMTTRGKLWSINRV